MSLTKKNLAVIILGLFSIATVLHLVNYYAGLSIPPMVLVGARWVTVAFAIVYALKKGSLTTWILLSMIIGVEIGLNYPHFAQNLQVLSKIFLSLVKTIIAPILFSTLVVGIAGHSNLKQVGRMGWKSILYFEFVTTLALVIGLIAINLTQAGAGIELPPGFNQELPEAKAQTWSEVILHVFPENFVKSVYHGDVLPIVVFSVIFGIALAMLPEKKKKPMLDFSESLAEAMFKFTNIIMHFAPFGVGAAIAVTVGHLGIDILTSLLKLLFTLYGSLLAFMLLVLLPIAYFLKIPIRKFIRAVSEPVSIAFATTSSESALPKAMENMEKLGVPRKIVSFVLPTGYTFNLDGTTLYLSLAAVFVAQAAGIPLTIGQQLLMGLTLMLTSKGVAGVPRASLVILLGTAASFGLPLWPIMAILGIDELMDMARTSVNVTGNCLATVVIAKWEKEYVEPEGEINFD
ncbi:MAG TPA: cation:dicarboxylase symporter family transporter [Cyclobacteriaceae bacterium]|nr:cation:dicarboxylase symporter family transporter [Cyclobacteriaceae bacterium]HRK52295.1 cation:dicarboxylase symporter family transporter [Cyclobacteriaceae bacterium]